MFGKNLKKIRSVHGLSQQQFAEMFDLKRATLGAYEEGRSNPKMETLMKIANHFSLDLEELLTKELTVNRLLKFNEHITVTSDTLKKETFDAIPCVTSKHKTDFLKALSKKTKPNLPALSLPFVSGANKLAFVIDDASMSGESLSFLPKDTVIGEKVPIENAASANGKFALIATKDELLFRRIAVHENSLTLQASQPAVDTIEIPIANVLGIWQLAHVFHYNLPSQTEVERRLALLESAIESLKK